MAVALDQAVNLISLVYHEARLVRGPIEDGRLLDQSKFTKLSDLPKDRKKAWRHLSALRTRATDSGSIKGACQEFQDYFGVGLGKLIELFEKPIWTGKKGGVRWAAISSKILDLVNAMETDNDPRATELYREILSMRHNTGQVCEKLRGLAALTPPLSETTAPRRRWPG